MPTFQTLHSLEPFDFGRSGVVLRSKGGRQQEVFAVKTFADRPDGQESFETERNAYASIASGVGCGKEAFLQIVSTIGVGTRPSIVLPFLPGNLAQLLAKEGSAGLVCSDIISITKQLISGIRYLHGLQIVHADIKPENIMLESLRTLPHVSSAAADVYSEQTSRTIASRDSQTHTVRPRRLEVCKVFIIDFADAVHGTGPRHGMIGTNEYRAPEVTLVSSALSWTNRVDWFSLGCVIAEMCSGSPLLPRTSSPIARLAAIVQVIGNLPHKMVAATGKRFEHFLVQATDSKYAVRLPRRNVKEAVEACQIRRLKSIESVVVDPMLLQLSLRLLRIDPTDRDPDFLTSSSSHP